MDNIAIRVENLSKQYRIGGPQARYKTIRESLTEAVQSPFRRLASVVRGQSSVTSDETIWALKDVSFEVQRGEVVGIIGRNGAGKTTLLKILSRITEPTEGQAEIHGRVGSLLEVGTGFHPELTGRENITLNGAILGMKRAEIDRKFDQIVAFAEIEKFIDTPVKHYSSGMYVRLAFSVAAHMEPEILLVDEVLAVGDAAFQKKCLGKMGDVAKEGRTVLFVSHNMSAIRALCQRTIWIHDGRIKADGDSELIVAEYLSPLQASNGASAVLKSVDGEVEIEQVLTKNQDGEITNVFRTGDPITIEIHYFARRLVRPPYLWVGVSGLLGRLFAANMVLDGVRPEDWVGRGQIRCTFRELPLLPQQIYGIFLGGRGGDNMTTMFNTAEVTHFRVAGSAQDIGFEGELAERVVGGSIPLLVPYTWELQDGRTVSVDPLSRVGKHEDS